MSDDKKNPLKIITPEFRGSYVALLEPRAVSQEKPDDKKYSILMVLKKDAPGTKDFIKRLEANIQVASQQKHGKPIPKERLKHYPIKDGDHDENPDFAGHWLISASNKFKPGIINLQGEKLFEAEDVYSGAWYRASVSPWGWDNPVGGKGVSLNLHNVVKTKDDEAFTSVSKPEDDFADLLSDLPAASSGADDDLFT